MATLTLPIQSTTVQDPDGDLTSVARGPIEVRPLGEEETQFAGDPLDLALIAVDYVGIQPGDREAISRLVQLIAV